MLCLQGGVLCLGGCVVSLWLCYVFGVCSVSLKSYAMFWGFVFSVGDLRNVL